MPRELTEALAPAMVPTAHVAAVPYVRSLLWMLMRHKLEALVIGAWVLWLTVRLLQSILGPKRRRYRNWFVQYGAMAAYYLPTLLALYTANAVYSSRSDIKLILVFASSVLLLLCTRGAVTMTALTLAHGPPPRLQSWRVLPWLLYFAWLQWGLIIGGHKLTVIRAIYTYTVICVLPVLYVLLVKPRAALLDYETKEFADYMVCESRSSSPFFLQGDDPNRLHDGCKYPFMLSKGEWIDFSHVLKVIGRLPRDRAVDPDTCLSYSFCQLLARRYFGFPCAEDGNAQVRDFVLKEILADCNRAFTIVEVQLALLHDYFFTNYHTVVTSGFVSKKQGIKKLLGLSLFSIGYTAIMFLITRGYKGGRSAVVIYFSTALLTSAIMTLIMLPRSPFMPRYWHPIQSLFRFYKQHGTSSPDSVIDRWSADPLSRQSSRVAYWREKMDQYSILEDYDRRSPMKTIMAWLKVHVLSQPSYSFIKHHPALAEEKHVSIPDSLKRLVARTIRELNGPPITGVMSLVMQGDNRAQLDDLSWTCRQDTLTHTILIWHLATCYCEEASNEGYRKVATTVSRYRAYLVSFLPKLLGGMSQPLEEETTDSLEEETPQSLDEDLSIEEYRDVAMALSRYCAYLVAFMPDLLPEHSLTAKVVLQQVLEKSRDLLGRTRMSMDAKRAKIRQLQIPEDESSLTTFHKGVRLGRQLEQQLEVLLRWKTMAEFWAEMILYIASSSGNATTHIELLAQGGSSSRISGPCFATLALLDLKRATEEPTPQQPEDTARVENDATYSIL